MLKKQTCSLVSGWKNGFTDSTTHKDWKDGKVALNRWAIRLDVFF
ncbi:hypothetical protein [Niabella ginsenosidivorans]|nr:hypothetical protein [Niabella ginsenosidivorans]